MAKKGKKNFSIKRVGEIMDELDTPHNEFNMGESFQKNGASAPPGPRPSQVLLSAFQRTFEPVDSEHLAHVLFTMGRLREYFQAWIVPKMPDPLPAYLEELDYMGYHVRTGFDGTACVMVRYQNAIDVTPENIVGEECTSELIPVEEIPVYTDDWKDDLSDIEVPFEQKE